MEALKGVNVKTGETVGAALAGDSGLKAKVEGIVRGFKVIGSPRYFSDGGVEMDVEVPLDGVLADVLLPKEEPKAVPEGGKLAGTGLVVNAKGLKFSHALAPRILDEKGQEIYGASLLTDDAKRTNGVAAYVKELDAAKSSLRVGKEPMVLKATKAQGSDIVISDADAATLRNANKKFLTEGRVVIVTD
jgi:hypothetical protein